MSPLPSTATGPGSPPPALAPEAVLGLIHCRPPQQLVRVRGRVASVRRYQGSIYGTLLGEGASLRFRIPSSFGDPPEGRDAIITGVLSASPSRMNPAFEILLTGHPEEAAPVVQRAAVALRPKRSLLRLHAFLAKNPLSRLHLLATATGLSDAESSYKQMRSSPAWTCSHPSFGDRERMLAAIARAQAGGAGALALLRGGGGDSSLALWDDPAVVAALLQTGLPFYTALGHSTDTLLADRYADEFFSTPTAFGSAAAQIEAELEKVQKLEAEVTALRRSRANSGPSPIAPFFGPGWSDRALIPILASLLLLAGAVIFVLLIRP